MTDSASSPSPGATPSPADSPYSAAPARPRNTIGLASFIVGAIAVFVGLAFRLAAPALISVGVGYDLYQIGSFTTSVLEFLLGLVAVVLGVVGLVRPAAPRGFAAAGTAIGAVAALEVAVGLLQGALYSAF